MLRNYISDSIAGLQNAVDVSSYATTSLSDVLKSMEQSVSNTVTYDNSTTIRLREDNYSDVEYLNSNAQFIDTGYKIDSCGKVVFKNGSYMLCVDEDNNSEQKGECEVVKTTNIAIIRYTIIKPNKVVEVEFGDEKTEKMVCHEDDVFDIRKCLFIAIAKHLYKDTYTWEGIEYMAQQLSYQKMYVKIVDKALKAHTVAERAEAKLRAKEQAKKDALENKKRKHARYVERRKQRRFNEQAKVVCEGMKMYDAYKESMREEN